MTQLSYNTQIDNSSHANFTDPDARVIREREILFHMGDELEGIYRVNSGCVKLFRNTEDGEEQIIGFYMSGDLIGLDALADGFSHSTAKVLETANVSLISFEKILNNEKGFDNLAFVHQLGVSHRHDNDHAMMLSQPAGRRLAWFLTRFSDRLAKRGMLADEFRMPMTGADIALYLGMASETSSRELKGFSNKGLIRKSNRNIELLDIEALRRLADSDSTEERAGWNGRTGLTLKANRPATLH